MVELFACALQGGDAFSKDKGETWHTVKVVREARRGTRTIVITRDGKEHIFNPDDLVLVK